MIDSIDHQNPSGFNCLLEGFRLIGKPGLRSYVIVPLLINIVLFSTMLGYGVVYFDEWITATLEELPAWLSFLSWLFWLLFLLLGLAFLIYGFTIVANLIASPFNAILAIKVEEAIRVDKHEVSEVHWYLVVPRALTREISKILYYLPRLIGLIILTLIPGINFLVSPLWVGFGAWMMTIQYADFAADNNNLTFQQLRDAMGKHRFNSLSFGIVVYFAMAIPFLNLIVLPAAVAGGTVFYVRRLESA